MRADRRAAVEDTALVAVDRQLLQPDAHQRGERPPLAVCCEPIRVAEGDACFRTLARRSATMRSEREKMLAGELYDSLDPELVRTTRERE